MYKTKIDNLDLKQIADSGQCFRWKNTGENEYTVVAFDRALRIKKDGNEFAHVFYLVSEIIPPTLLGRQSLHSL